MYIYIYYNYYSVLTFSNLITYFMAIHGGHFHWGGDLTRLCPGSGTQRNHGEVLISSGKSWSKDHSHVAHVAKKGPFVCADVWHQWHQSRGENLSVEEAMNYVGGYCVVLDLTGGNLGAWGRCNVEQRGTTWNNVGRLGAAIHWVNLGWGIVQIAERFKG